MTDGKEVWKSWKAQTKAVNCLVLAEAKERVALNSELHRIKEQNAHLEQKLENAERQLHDCRKLVLQLKKENEALKKAPTSPEPPSPACSTGFSPKHDVFELQPLFPLDANSSQPSRRPGSGKRPKKQTEAKKRARIQSVFGEEEAQEAQAEATQAPGKSQLDWNDKSDTDTELVIDCPTDDPGHAPKTTLARDVLFDHSPRLAVDAEEQREISERQDLVMEDADADAALSSAPSAPHGSPSSEHVTPQLHGPDIPPSDVPIASPEPAAFRQCSAPPWRDASTGSFLEQMMQRQQRDHGLKSTQLAAVKELCSQEATSYTHQIHKNLVLSQLGRLWTHQCTGDTLASVVKMLVKSDGCWNLLIQHLFVAIRDEKTTDDEDSCQVIQVCGAWPRLTLKQCKVASLLIMMLQQEPHTNLIDPFLKLIRYTLFRGKQMDSLRLHHLTNISRIYVFLLRYRGSEQLARLFLYDIMFFRNARSHVLANVVLETWPCLLSPSKVASNPLNETLVWLIYNTGLGSSDDQLKVYSSRRLLHRVCGVVKPAETGIQLADRLIDLVQQRADQDPAFCDDATKSLILLARWHNVSWTKVNVCSKVIDMLKDSSSPQRQSLLIWVVNCIGSLARNMPVQGRDELLALFNPISELLHSDSISAKLEAACLKSLIWTGHHLQVQLSMFLLRWKPKFQLPDDVSQLLLNYLGSRGHKHGTLTIQRKAHQAKKKKTKKRKKPQPKQVGGQRNSLRQATAPGST